MNIYIDDIKSLKNVICSNSLLKYSEINSLLIIRTIASSYIIGAVLLQVQENSNTKFLIYFI